jgi:hypothetical protein
MTIDYLKEHNLIVYEYIRGSKLHGIAGPDSDTDIGGVYVAPEDVMFGFDSDYERTVSDDKGDTTYFELRTYCELLNKSNPNALESLFVPDNLILYCDPVFKEMFLNNKNKFLSQDAFPGMIGYAKSQIYKARGLNKKIVNPITERKGVLDFCYVPWGQGSKKVKDWLYDNGLKQKYCGLVALPNMHDLYGLYYDWGTHLICEYGADLKNKTNLREVWGKLCNEMNENIDVGEYEPCFASTFEVWGLGRGEFLTEYEDFVKHTEHYGFTGIVSETEDSNEVRVCTVPKNLKPLIYMTYNKSGYESHCRDYKDYKEWEQKRNPVRYESNLNKNYDGKNMSECMRLTTMALELAETGEYNIVRTTDREFLLNIRAHKYEYDIILNMAEEISKKFETAAMTSTLQKHVDTGFCKSLLIDFRKYFYDKILKS